jgi:tyrosine-protein kinase Etk/Wzc
MIGEDITQRNVSFESYRQRITNFSNEFELGLFLYILRRSLLWILLVLLTSLTTALLYLKYTAPIYEARSILQLRESNTAEQVLSMSTFAEDKNLYADVEFMRSHLFLGMALDRLPLSVSYFNRGQILTEEYYTRTFFPLEDVVVTDSVIMDQPVFVNLSEPGRVGITYTVAGTPYKASFERTEPIRMPHFSCRMEFRHHSILADPEAEVNLYFRMNSHARLLEQYSQQLIVKILDPGAKTVEVSCKNQNPVIARDISQAMAESFINYDVDRQGESALSVIHFIRTQKDTVFEQLRESEFKLQEFRIDNRVADMDLLTPLFLERSSQYEDDLVHLTLDIELLKALEAATDKPMDQLNPHDLVPLLLGTKYEATLANTIRDLQDLLRERGFVQSDATPEHPAAKSIERQIDTQKRVLLESLRRMRRTAETRHADLMEQLVQYDERFRSLPGKELDYARIERVFNINEKYYTMLLEKEIEYRISKAGFVPENRILQNASLPGAPVSPNRNMVLVSYLVTGLIICFLIVLVRYIMHDNVTSLHDIAKLSHASIGILGMIPKYKKEIPISQLLIDKNPKSLIAEAFRTVRTNMQFVDNTPGPKVIAITSTISGEGKTFVAMNLAGIISFSGKRVIILDLDMRKPKIHLGFDVDNALGMSTVLIGKDTVDNCIRKSSLSDLDFITAGPIPPNPSELIISPRMSEVLAELKLRYDVILLDNPPVGLVTDGLPMIQLADYPIYIFRSDYSKKQFVQNVDRLINENNIKRLTCILNGVDIDRNKYGYNYGYGYGYGYGYTGGYYEERTRKGKGGAFGWLLGKG